MITRRRFVEISATAAFAPSLITQSSAQAWPNRIVHLVVPFPAGVAPDIGGRLIAARLSEV